MSDKLLSEKLKKLQDYLIFDYPEYIKGIKEMIKDAEHLEKQVQEFKGLMDMNGQIMEVGNVYTNGKLSAPLCSGKYSHHCGSLEVPSFGYYFDGDEGFYLSDYIVDNKDCHSIWRVLN